MDRARGKLRLRDSRAALTLWQALVSGRWSLVDRFESDGRRFVVAMKNAPEASDPRALTGRERTVACYAARGDSNKLIGYALGIAEGTVAALLSRVLAKLGLRARSELAGSLSAWEQASDARLSALIIDSNQLRVVAVDGGCDVPLPKLTPREKIIAKAVAQGKSNGEIARQLSCAPQTVANTLTRLFSRLDVASRAELAQRIGQHDGQR